MKMTKSHTEERKDVKRQLMNPRERGSRIRGQAREGQWGDLGTAG